jgi:hypothetical protein
MTYVIYKHLDKKKSDFYQRFRCASSRNGCIGRSDVGMLISAGDWILFEVLASCPIIHKLFKLSRSLVAGSRSTRTNQAEQTMISGLFICTFIFDTIVILDTHSTLPPHLCRKKNPCETSSSELSLSHKNR